MTDELVIEVAGPDGSAYVVRRHRSGSCAVTITDGTTVDEVAIDSERVLARLTDESSWPVVYADALDLVAAAWVDGPPDGWNRESTWSRAALAIAYAVDEEADLEQEVQRLLGPVLNHPAAALLLAHPDEQVRVVGKSLSPPALLRLLRESS